MHLVRHMHPAQLTTDDLLTQCVIERTRRGGPGGQHRNKTETAVVISHNSGITGSASERRSQDLNRREAIIRLRLNLATGLRTAPSDNLSPEWIAFSNRTSNRVSIHSDVYPALLAEALDHFADCKYELSVAASRLQVSSARLTSLIKCYPPALRHCNVQRQYLGLHPLR